MSKSLTTQEKQQIVDLWEAEPKSIGVKPFMRKHGIRRSNMTVGTLLDEHGCDRPHSNHDGKCHGKWAVALEEQRQCAELSIAREEVMGR